jgi:outer membrane protein assembly factor BamB
LKWSFNANNSNVTSKPALDTIGSDRFVYFSAADSRIYKMEADPPGTTGVQERSWAVGGSIAVKVSPAVNNISHKIYIGSTNDNLYEYNSLGTQLWSRDLGDDIQATPTIDQTGGSFDGNVYQGTDDESGGDIGHVFAFDPGGATPSTPLWNFPTDNDIQSQPAINNDGTVIYAVSDIGIVYAISTATGSPPAIWTRDLPAVNFLDPAVWVKGAAPDGTVYVPTDGGVLYALNPANGSNRTGWPKDLGNSITFSSPAVGPDGTVYIGTDDGIVHAINPDGTDKWVGGFPTGAAVQSSPEIGADGVVYVGSNDGNLYAISTVAMPRNYRNNYASGQQGYLTSADLDSNVVVDDPDNWLDGSTTSNGPWAVRTEIKRATSVNGNGSYEYTLLTWIRQCAQSDCSDIKDTPFQDTTGEYTFLPGPPFPNLPFEQVIELTPAEHDDFERFLFGFTTAASATDTQTVEIRDFQLTFSQSGDPTIIADPTWIP